MRVLESVNGKVQEVWGRTYVQWNVVSFLPKELPKAIFNVWGSWIE